MDPELTLQRDAGIRVATTRIPASRCSVNATPDLR